MYKFSTLLAMLALFQGCENNIADADPIIEDCLIIESYYSSSVAPIMAQSCNGCHSGTSPSGGILTNNYEDVKNGLNSIINRVERDINVIGFMPLGGEKLTNDKISILHQFLEMECE
ncbi:hypothetical protein OAC91_00220 [Candidatus Marinimicrobia bacterium]|jgi:hypothetical protein|nr:hypothetical protein [Candidatus Neomarinimicrobiota bacterium]|tara:strand:+ start:15885 stop:16235 length:351 start_codon:yes stop_codon:yes gene_type:complete